jgi:phosphoglycolate phosphatase
MVGDRASDVTDARMLGVDAVGVLWGFGSAEELTNAGAIALCDTPLQIVSMI